VADDSDSDDWYALDIGAKSIEMITPDTSIRAVIRAVRDLPPSDILLLGELLDTLRKPTSYETLLKTPFELLLPRMTITATAIVKPPYPADLVQAPPQDAVKARQAQLRTLAMVLIWLMAIIVPIVQQRFGAEGQAITDAEVGTTSLALAITVLMKQSRK
jgi:hypothetical protein